MTWVVVFGSSLVMMLWIVVFSFFPSNDFVDEVSILFGTIYFWASVLLAATICLGMFRNLFAGILKLICSCFSTSLRYQVRDVGLLPTRQGHRSRDVGHGRPEGSTWNFTSQTQKEPQERKRTRGCPNVPRTAQSIDLGILNWSQQL